MHHHPIERKETRDSNVEPPPMVSELHLMTMAWQIASGMMMFVVTSSAQGVCAHRAYSLFIINILRDISLLLLLFLHNNLSTAMLLFTAVSSCVCVCVCCVSAVCLCACCVGEDALPPRQVVFSDPPQARPRI